MDQLISSLSFCYKVLIWNPLVITKISAFFWLPWYIMTVNISVVGIENGVPVLTDEIDSSRHCIHNSNNVWHILHYLFRKRYILSSTLFILALIYKLSVLHCTLQIVCGGHWDTTFNDGITSKYIWMPWILRNVILYLYWIELIKYISYFIYMVIS